jgi:hypothetical protein
VLIFVIIGLLGLFTTVTDGVVSSFVKELIKPS